MIGLLGNTGNTDSPHLHFHVMDSPSPPSQAGPRTNQGPLVLDVMDYPAG